MNKFLSENPKMIGVVINDETIVWSAKDTEVNLYKANQVKEILAKKYPEDTFKICQMKKMTKKFKAEVEEDEI